MRARSPRAVCSVRVSAIICRAARLSRASRRACTAIPPTAASGAERGKQRGQGGRLRRGWGRPGEDQHHERDSEGWGGEVGHRLGLLVGGQPVQRDQRRGETGGGEGVEHGQRQDGGCAGNAGGGHPPEHGPGDGGPDGEQAPAQVEWNISSADGSPGEGLDEPGQGQRSAHRDGLTCGRPAAARAAAGHRVHIRVTAPLSPFSAPLASPCWDFARPASLLRATAKIAPQHDDNRGRSYRLLAWKRPSKSRGSASGSGRVALDGFV